MKNKKRNSKKKKTAKIDQFFRLLFGTPEGTIREPFIDPVEAVKKTNN